MKSLFTLICLLALSVSCSQSGSKASLKVRNTLALGGADVYAGGLMIWGQGPNGQSFGRVLTSTNEVSVNLPNGEWAFYAMAWDGSSFSGTVSCAQAKTSLAGEQVAVDLLLSNTNCSQSAFAGSAPVSNTAPIQLPKTKIEFCEKVDDTFTAASDACTDNLLNTNRKSGKGSGVSYRFRARAYDRIKGVTNFLAETLPTTCFSGEPMAANEESGLAYTEASALPAGISGVTPFHLTLEVYLGTNDCDVNNPTLSKGVVTYELPHGVSSTFPNLKSFVDTSLAPARHKLYIEIKPETICSSTRLNVTPGAPFAAGSGTAGRPYLICTAEQFQAIVTASTTNHYKLLNNIDLNPLTKALTTLTTPSWYSCLDEGSNFFPIGGNTSDCHTSTPSEFTGSLNGNGKKISGLRMRLEEKNRVGLFAILAGSVRNLTLERVEISGASEVGALAGNTWSGAYLQNIIIAKPQIEARHRDASPGGYKAGSLVGVAENTIIDNIRVVSAKVDGEKGVTGGLIGYAQYVTLSNALVSGEVRGIRHQDQNNYSSVGGLFGEAYFSSISKSRFEGYIRGQTNVGGLVGNLYNTSVSDSYAHAGIYSSTYNAEVYAGGLFGRVYGTSGTHKVERAFFTGDISHNCTLNTACYISEVAGTISGVSASDFTYVYHPNLNYTGTYNSVAIGTPASLMSHYAANAFPDLGSAFDQSLTGDIPRLVKETYVHPCRQISGATANVSAQMNTPYFRGTSSNPIALCNPNQFTDIQNYPSAHYKLANYVVGPPLNGVGQNFSGSLDGNGFGIVGLKILNGAQTSLFNEISGTIKNISFLGSTVSGFNQIALLGQTLSGTVENLHVDGLIWYNANLISSGGLFHTISSSGKLDKARINFQMATSGYAGGIANENNGIISNIRMDGGIVNSTPGSSFMVQVGGVVVTNSAGGLISRVENNLRIHDDASSPNADGAGIALIATANIGTIQDIHIDHGGISTQTSQTAGIVSLNYSNAVVQRVIASADIQVRNELHGRGSNEFDVSATIGTYYGSSTDLVSETYYTKPALWLFPNQVVPGVSTDPTYCYISTSSWGLSGSSWETAYLASPSSYGVYNHQNGFTPFTGYVTSNFKILGPDNCNKYSSLDSHLSRPGTSPGTFLTDANNNWATFSNWNLPDQWVANMDDANDRKRVFDIYKAYLTGSPLPENPPVWEYRSDEGMRLFRLDD